MERFFGEPGSRPGVIWREVGFSNAQLASWLLRFGEIELSKADVDTRREMREQLRAWITLSGTPEADRSRLYCACPSPSAAHGTATDEAVALQANEWFRQLLFKPAHPEIATLVTPTITYRIDIVRHRGSGAASRWVLLSEATGSDLDLFQLYAHNSFAAYRTGLRLCARCSRIFLPRGRMAYCSKRCSNTERKRRFRKKIRVNAGRQAKNPD